MSQKKILLICNTFPPAPGIGGRRWAKFCKYLAINGYKIHVATLENLSEGVSEWNKDIANNSSIVTHPLNFKYRRLFLKPRNIFEKIIRKITVKKLALTKYSERFLTSLPNPEAWQKIKDILIKENIKTIIVSGDPFLFYYATQLKKETGCRLILDYRDLWNDHSFYRKYFRLTDKQWNFFEEAENSALKTCDIVITVDEHLKQILSQRLASEEENKIHVIHNGFDSDDFTTTVPARREENKKITLYFSGNIATDLNEIVLHFANCFSRLKQNLPQIYSGIEIHLKGKMDDMLLEKLSALNLESLILGNNFVNLKTYNEEVLQADVGILLLSEEYANSYTTKFSDYLFLNKKMLVLGYPGEVSVFLKATNCGDIFTINDNYTFFEKIETFCQTTAVYNEKTKEIFNVKNLNNELISLLEN
ncbi:MAG TPA: glycosyltransferase [Bacteroidia bacterium]|jgi:glycosyltransferase involved in cell wall biosynthesis|nr:glycosyltransferase [Bacteroidia bacterium]